MRHTRAWPIIVATAAVLLAGCSGTGAPPADVRGASVQTLASDQVSAASLMRDWLKQLYVKRGPLVPGEVHNHEGDHYWGVTATGAVYDYHMADDGSGSGTWTYPGDLVETDTWTAGTFNAAYTRVFQDAVMEFSNGFKMQVHWMMDLTSPYAAQTYKGKATVPSGQTMNFVWQRDDRRDAVSITLPDHSNLKFGGPLTAVVGAASWPVFERGLTGTYTNAGGVAMGLKLTGSSATEQWTTWEMTAAEGMTASFALTPGLATATGELRQNGAVAGNLRWDEARVGTLDLLGAGSQAVSPTAAARDFQMDRWVANSSWLAPIPSY